MFDKLKKIFEARLRSSGAVTINGKTYRGENVCIDAGGSVTIDGKVVGSEVGLISVSVTGRCDSVASTSGDVTVNGDVRKVETTSGDVVINGAAIGVETVSGDVHAQSIQRARTVSGDVHG